MTCIVPGGGAEEAAHLCLLHEWPAGAGTALSSRRGERAALLVRRALHRCRPGFAPCVQLVIHQSARVRQQVQGCVQQLRLMQRRQFCVCDTDLSYIGCGRHLRGREAKALEERLNYMLHMQDDGPQRQGTRRLALTTDRTCVMRQAAATDKAGLAEALAERSPAAAPQHQCYDARPALRMTRKSAMGCLYPKSWRMPYFHPSNRHHAGQAHACAACVMHGSAA
jgi:hypothetical protein